MPGLLTFQPIFKERIWGGRNLERLYGKKLPPGAIGESWEITDRPEGISVVDRGPQAGADLHGLLERHGRELLGEARAAQGRFPLLVKILDAEDKLSLQVHPPPEVAARLGGEPKTEMWYIADAAPGAELYVGLRRGITKAEFARAIEKGTVADCFHRLKVRAGDAIFLPSGRVHAIGAGLVIFEIQQNSDTTYRVFDWNRLDDRGKPRDLHIAQSLESIDFADYEPGLITSVCSGNGHAQRVLVEDSLFTVRQHRLEPGSACELTGPRCAVVGVIAGTITIENDRESVGLKPGGFCLVAASAMPVTLKAGQSSSFLEAVPG